MTHCPLLSHAAGAEVATTCLSSAGTAAVQSSDTRMHTHKRTHTHITYKLWQRVGTQAPTGESHGEREKVWAGKVVCVGECEYARVCVCICRVFAVVTAGMREWRRRVWLEEVPTEQVSLYFHHTQVCPCVDICSWTLCTSVFVSVKIYHRCKLVCMYRTWSYLKWEQYGAVMQCMQNVN